MLSEKCRFCLTLSRGLLKALLDQDLLVRRRKEVIKAEFRKADLR